MEKGKLSIHFSSLSLGRLPGLQEDILKKSVVNAYEVMQSKRGWPGRRAGMTERTTLGRDVTHDKNLRWAWGAENKSSSLEGKERQQCVGYSWDKTKRGRVFGLCSKGTDMSSETQVGVLTINFIDINSMYLVMGLIKTVSFKNITYFSYIHKIPGVMTCLSRGPYWSQWPK